MVEPGGFDEEEWVTLPVLESVRVDFVYFPVFVVVLFRATILPTSNVIDIGPGC